MPHCSIDRNVSDPTHSVDYLFSLIGNPLIKGEVRAVDLDGVDTLNAGQRLLDVVFDILRIAKTCLRKVTPEPAIDVVGQLLLGKAWPRALSMLI